MGYKPVISKTCPSFGHLARRGAGTGRAAAHEWFNLATPEGSERGQECRADIADEMSAREIAEAQKQARAWLSGMQMRLAA